MTDDDIVDGYFAAFKTADRDAILGLISPGAVIWHNFDERDRDIAASLGEIQRLGEYMADMRYEIFERFPVNGGVGVRLVLRAVLRASGENFTSHQVKFFRIRDGKIARIEEYVAPPANRPG
jgi:ketosteroid isomerase-like protein